MHDSLPRLSGLLLLLLLVGGCTASAPPAPESEFVSVVVTPPTATPPPTGAVPTRAATATSLPPPTPAPPPTATSAPTPTPVAARYEVRYGDTLIGIAAAHNCTVDELLALNGLTADAGLRAGQVLVVPDGIERTLPPVTLLPDPEVIYGSAYLHWDTAAFVAARGGRLASHQEGSLSGAEVIDAVAARYGVGPRVLLALMEMSSGWVTRAEPLEAQPFGMAGDDEAPALHWQATWVARQVANGFYEQLDGRRDWIVLPGGERVRLYPGTNAGSAGILQVMAGLPSEESLESRLARDTFGRAYRRLFGTPDAASLEVPPQPYFALPFDPDELWYFTGGPHGGYYNVYSGWAALDFAPPVARGCWPAPEQVLAVADGLVVRSQKGELWLDLDGDGDLRTGWVVFYMHLAAAGRTPAGSWVTTGTPIGVPSCEGGVASGSHVHLARMYNGLWVPAAGQVPFQLGEWVVDGDAVALYDGAMRRVTTGERLEACNCRFPRGNRFPEKPYFSGR